jgi:glycosyltransferase involved in cell wall biosynthesis
MDSFIKKPHVSIITPSYNQGEFLEDTILSVLSQDYSDIEYILIDGGSTDNSMDIIRQYEDRISDWVSEKDMGQAHAINKGLLRSRGEFLGWLNSDDILLPSTVSRVIKVFNEYPDIDVVYGRLERIDERNKVIPTPILPKDRIEFSKEYVIGECVVNQPGAFWRRRIMEKAGLLDQNLKYALDYEFWIRIALAGGQFRRIPEVVARFRLNRLSKTSNQTSEMAMEQLNVLERTLTIEDLDRKLGINEDRVRRCANKARSVIQLHVSYGYLKKRKIGSAIYWLWRALQNNPLTLFEKRWLDLAVTGLTRRVINW